MSAYPGLALHLIGPLQSNKAKEAIALFDAIHSVDRPSICEALAKEISSQKRRPQLFVQLNTGEEPQKAGVAPADADAFIAGCREKYGLEISGLMCIPPVDDAPAPHFALTAKIAARNGLKNLSMGMSADFAARFSQAPPMCASARRFSERGKNKGLSSLHPIRSWCAAPAAAAAAASRPLTLKRTLRSGKNSRGPNAKIPRCRARRCAASCYDRSRR
jgi:Predicted enzyme with a TIM-barrel fold